MYGKPEKDDKSSKISISNPKKDRKSVSAKNLTMVISRVIFVSSFQRLALAKSPASRQRAQPRGRTGFEGDPWAWQCSKDYDNSNW